MSRLYGRCFTFNSDGAIGNVTSPGPSVGLRLLLNVNQGDYMLTSDTAGVRVSVHSPRSDPFPESLAYNAKVGSRTSLSLTHVETDRMTPPHGQCGAPADIDHSYYYTGAFTTEGCLFSCLQDKIVANCSCASYAFPAPPGVAYCGADKKKCAEQAERLHSREIELAGCGCVLPCHESSYKATIHQAVFPSDVIAKHTFPKHCPPHTPGCHTGESAKKDAVQLEIYFERLNFYQFTEEETITLHELVSDLGGQIGLWIGVSVCTFVEFFSLLVTCCLFLCGCHRGTSIERKQTDAQVEPIQQRSFFDDSDAAASRENRVWSVTSGNVTPARRRPSRRHTALRTLDVVLDTLPIVEQTSFGLSLGVEEPSSFGLSQRVLNKTSVHMSQRVDQISFRLSQRVGQGFSSEF